MTAARLLLVTGACSLLLAGTANATTPAASGYWWIAETGQVAVPAPSTVPQNGLYVASAASGATAISAVRFTLPVDRVNAQLVLKVHQLQQGDTLAVDACTTSSLWMPGSAQPWSARPSCTAGAIRVHGVLSSDSTTVAFALTSLQPGESANLLLLPGAAAPAAAGAPAAPSPTFDVSFEPFVAGSVVSTEVQPPAGPGPAFGSSAGEAPAYSQPAVPAAAPPALFAPLVPSAPATVSPTVETPHVDPLIPTVTQQLPAAATATVGPSERSGRDKALLVLMLGVAMFYLGWLARSQTGSTTRSSIYDLPSAQEDA